MKIGFVVNDVLTEKAAYTTTRLAMTATNRGHRCALLGVGDFIYDADGSIHARCRTVSGEKSTGHDRWLATRLVPSDACARATD